MFYKITKYQDADWQSEAENVSGATPNYSEESEEYTGPYAIDIFRDIDKELLDKHKIELDYDDWNKTDDETIVIYCYFYAPKSLELDDLKEIFDEVAKDHKIDWNQIELSAEVDDDTNLYLIDLYIYTKYFDDAHLNK